MLRTYGDSPIFCDDLFGKRKIDEKKYLGTRYHFQQNPVYKCRCMNHRCWYRARFHRTGQDHQNTRQCLTQKKKEMENSSQYHGTQKKINMTRIIALPIVEEIKLRNILSKDTENNF